MSYQYYSYNELVDIFSEERILNRARDLSKFLGDFIETPEFKNKNFKLGYSINELSMALCLDGFNLFANFTKPFMSDDKRSNEYKVAANLIYTILKFDNLFVAEGSISQFEVRKQKVAFALYVATMVLTLQDNHYSNWFNRYLDTNSGQVNADFDMLQEHFIYYLTHLNIEDLLQMPVVLLSLFLHSFTMWWKFDGDTSSFHGLQL